MIVHFVYLRSSLPELLEKKRLIDQHTNIATALLEQIKVLVCRRNCFSAVELRGREKLLKGAGDRTGRRGQSAKVAV